MKKWKKCYKCQDVLPLTEFNKNKSKRDGYQYKCKECEKKYQKEWYKKNKKRHIWNSAKNKKRRKKELRIFIKNIKKQSQCKLCGENCWYCLVFHHRDENDKRFNISNVPNLGYGLNTIKQEMDKCDIVCVNCHKEIHHFLRLEKSK